MFWCNQLVGGSWAALWVDRDVCYEAKLVCTAISYDCSRLPTIVLRMTGAIHWCSSYQIKGLIASRSVSISGGDGSAVSLCCSGAWYHEIVKWARIQHRNQYVASVPDVASGWSIQEAGCSCCCRPDDIWRKQLFLNVCWSGFKAVFIYWTGLEPPQKMFVQLEVHIDLNGR